MDLELGTGPAEHSALTRYGRRCPCGVPARRYLTSWRDGTPWYTCHRATPPERTDLRAYVESADPHRPD